MNGMGGEVIDGSGTIDPANLSNSGTYHCAVLAAVACVVSRLFCACFHRRDRSIARTPRAIGHLRQLAASSRCLLPMSCLFPVAFLQTDAPPSLCYAGTIPC